MAIYFGIGQTIALCPKQQSGFKIENCAYIPSVVVNLDDTETFVRFGKSSKILFLLFESQSLIRDLMQSVPHDIFIFESYFNSLVNSDSTVLSAEPISFVDEKKFDLKKYCSISDSTLDPCPDVNLPYDYYLKVEFSFDENKDLFLIKSFGPTLCGNIFLMALKG